MTDTPEEWTAVLVDVLKDAGRPMHQAEVSKITAKICGVSILRMPFVVETAINRGLIVRGSVSERDLLFTI